MVSCVLALALLLGATEEDVLLEGAATEPAPAPAPKRGAAFNLALDAGLPGGIALGLQLEPAPTVRFSLAGLTNVMGFGIRGGLEVLPWGRHVIHPLIGVEAGHHFPGETRRLIKNGPEYLSYTFVTGLLGLEARLARVTLHLAAGVSGVWATTSAVTLFSRVQLERLAIDGIFFAARLGLSVRLF
jgi:hypothetical protein